MSRENISLWEGVPVLEGQLIHRSMSRERTSHNNSFETEYFTLAERENKQLNGVFIMFSLLRDSRAPISLTKLMKCGFASKIAGI